MNTARKADPDRISFPDLRIASGAGAAALLPEVCAAGYHLVLLENTRCRSSCNGWCAYDYSDGTLFFAAPERAAELLYSGLGCGDARLLAFRAGLLSDRLGGGRSGCGAPYTYFRYRCGEALHLSVQERATVVRCMEDIRAELSGPTDACSRPLLAGYVGMLLDYGLRYYERQFITRSHVHAEILRIYDLRLCRYVASGRLRSEGMPAVAAFSVEFGMSEAYFDDLLRFERGLTHEELVRRAQLEEARRQLLATSEPVARIAEELGFGSLPAFRRLFRKLTGMSPDRFRVRN